MKKMKTQWFRIFIVMIIVTGVVSCSKVTESEFKPGSNLFNQGWEFVKDIDNSDDVLLNEGGDFEWNSVSIPHTANIEPLVIKGDQWQGNCTYRKFFSISEELAGKHLGFYFEGAMQVAEIYLNGKLLKTNLGGYLPFYVDITKEAKLGEKNCLIVKLNNEDNPLVPPGKALDVLDFNIYSGIYRNIWFEVKDPLHISNEIEVDKVAGGGVFVTYNNVSNSSAQVNVKVDIKNDNPIEQNVKIGLELLEKGNKVSSVVSESHKIEGNAGSAITTSFEVKNPKLWSPNAPNLYKLKVRAIVNGEEKDSRELKIGIRTIEISKEGGFVINGEPLKIRGTNRHQEYPYIGYAISDNANYRDAWKIKDAGFNFVRLSHYPQSRSFLKACDELGILVMDAIPGWQFFGNKEFQENAINDIRKMVRIDRNHPSIILWEASLNESSMDSTFMEKAHNVVHEEFPGKDVYTCGWLDYAYDVFIPARQHSKPPNYWNDYSKNKAFFIAEYGDWEYYAHNAGFNQKAFQDLSPDERNSRQLRAYGQKRLAQQALNYQEAHNSNLQGNAIGDANWLMFDYNRGYAPDLEASGIMDIFRLPKFAYYFYKSQVKIGESIHEDFSKPMIAIANYYSDPSFLNVKVYSNCEEVELLVNGKSIGKQKPDKDRNSTDLIHPPFTFKLDAFTPGQIVAKGYVDEKVIVEKIQNTPLEAKGLMLWIDESGKKLESGCNDIVFAYAAVVDKNGTILPLATNNISFNIQGDAKIIGTNPINAEAGIATVLLQAGEFSGRIKLGATSEGLENGFLEIDVK